MVNYDRQSSNTQLGFSLRERQIDSLTTMLKSESNESPWKILVYDSLSESIIAPLLKVQDIRRLGVTLHLNIEKKREAVPDVQAVYYVAPTSQNISLIAKDINNGIYGAFYINFSSPESDIILEEFAKQVVSGGAADLVQKIYDQYTNFISLEKDLFSLSIPKSYIAFNDPLLTDVQAKTNVEQVSTSLFSAIVTLGTIPIIRCPKNGASELIAKELEKKIIRSNQQTKFYIY